MCKKIEDIEKICNKFVDDSQLNRVAPEIAIRPDLAGFAMYEHPLVGVASASDPLFQELKRPEVVGPVFRAPLEWLPDAKSVISFFLPFTEAVVTTNRVDPEWPSAEWLHARIDGEPFIRGLSAHLRDTLIAAGHSAASPGIHPEFKSYRNEPGKTLGESSPIYPTSNWSERHVGYVAGLGTFGLSAAIITRRGVTGRLGSVVTSLELPPTERPYRVRDEYCSHCGACAKACPVLSISVKKGRKDKQTCAAWLRITETKFAPRYGCGKCYVNVPCESRAPAAKGQC